MSNKQNDIIKEQQAETDIRYRAKCFQCGAKLSDWALQLPEDLRFCYNCKGPKIENLKKKWN